MAEPTIRASQVSLAADAEFGEDVVIEADDVEVGAGARIGFSDRDDFRTAPGVRIQVRRLVVGRGVVIGRSVRIEGGEIRLDEGVHVQRNSTIRVLDLLHVGAGGTIGEDCEISGRRVRIGQELWMLPQAKIGGGSAFENSSQLDAGHFLHLGVQTLVNTARPVRIGHEVGLGTRTSVYTHGAYPSRLMGFPVAFEGVEIGDFSWVPGAIINPGVRIGRNCVIGVNSLVTSDIPDGCLAAGSPATIIREGAYPRPLSEAQQLDFFEAFFRSYAAVLGDDVRTERLEAAVRLDATDATYVAAPRLPDAVAAALDPERRVVVVADCGQRRAADAWTIFDPSRRRIAGAADAIADRLANELRRYGIRFYSRGVDGRYVDWEVEPPRFVTSEPGGSAAM